MMVPQRAQRLRELVAEVGDGNVVFLTGAGISAESGIPTFRGEEGYWQVGSRNYHPQELATWAAWQQIPDEVWAWYLFRRGVCRAAEPNAAHLALVKLEQALGDRLRIVTQNVDGLHLRAGNAPDRTYQIHGNIDFMRCADECGPGLFRVPELGAWPKERRVSDTERSQLVCGRCGGRARPHVLWFDESYDEENYRWQSTVAATNAAAMLVIVGTSGATSLPMRMAEIAQAKRKPLVVINRDPSPFTEMAKFSAKGLVLPGTAGEYVPQVVQALVGV